MCLFRVAVFSVTERLWSATVACLSSSPDLGSGGIVRKASEMPVFVKVRGFAFFQALSASFNSICPPPRI